MHLLNESIFNNKDYQEKAKQLFQEIKECLWRSGNQKGNSVSIAAYLLYQTSRCKMLNEITFQTVAENSFPIDEDVRVWVRKNMSEEIWLELIKLVSKYSLEIFALTVLLTGEDSDIRDLEITPRSIVELSQNLLCVNPDDKVADICCGSGTYLVSTSLKEPRASFYGYEINIDNYIVTKIRSELLEADIKVECEDVFNLNNKKDKIKFDKIFANYPFGLRLKNLGAGIQYLEQLSEQYPDLSKATSSDWIFNALLCELLEKSGKAVSIMTNGSTWNSIDIPMRKYFIERGLVECVISLPERMFNFTRIPTTMLVLSHNNSDVRMVDATKLCHKGRRQNEFCAEDIVDIIKACKKDSVYSKRISLEELRQNEYILNLNHYITDKVTFANGVLFGDIIKRITRGAPCSAKQLDEMASHDTTNMHYLLLANIQDGTITDDLPYLSRIDPKYDKYCLKNNSLILSKNGYPYKVAVATVKEGQRILANGNLYIIELNEEIANPYYVKAFLESKQGHAALKNITVGATIPNIGIDKLKKIEIPLPSIEEQNKIAQKYKDTLDEIMALKLRLNKTINKLHHILDGENIYEEK